MLSQWLSRGLGQIVAPDPHHEEKLMSMAEDEEAYGESGESLFLGDGFWNIVAPDPNFSPGVKKDVLSEKQEGGVKSVQCIHCHKMTPVYPNGRNNILTVDNNGQSGDAYLTPGKSSTPLAKSSPDASSYRTPPTSSLSKYNSSTGKVSGYDEVEEDSESSSNNPGLSRVEWRVLVATRETAVSLSSPPVEWECRKEFFNICTSTKVFRKRLINRFRRDLSLIHARSSNMSNFVPDGYTPLMAAASHGNLEICQILIELLTDIDLNPSSIDITSAADVTFLSPQPASTSTAQDRNDNTNNNNMTMSEGRNHKQYYYHKKKNKGYQKEDSSHLKDALLATNLQGKTALHLAAENHQLEIVRLLRKTMKQHEFFHDPVGIHAPQDLVGRTPLGCATLSTRKKKNQKQLLEKELYAVGDNSVFGKHTPAKQRTNHNITCNDASLVYGWSDMPGYRIQMEDSMCHYYPLTYGKQKNGQWGLFGVFDGHADQGVVSSFLAENILHVLEQTEQYQTFEGGTSLMAQALTEACQNIDVDLRAWLGGQNKSVRNGGSTAVMAAITEEAIIVANVGDCRCILIQKKTETKNNDKLNSSDVPSLEEEETNDLDVINDEGLHNGQNSTEKSDKSNSKEEKEAKLQNEEKTQEKNESIPESISNLVAVKAMSIDHKPNLIDERIRIENSGMSVVPDVFRAPSSDPDDENAYTTIWKVEKSEMEKMGVSRAFGDFDYKDNEELPSTQQAIISIPDFEVHARDSERDLFLVLACDGVWDVMTNEEVGDFIHARVQDYAQQNRSDVNSIKNLLPQVGDDLLKHCLELGSRDNMSVLIIALTPDQLQSSTSTTHNNINNNSNDGVKRAMNFAEV